MSGRSVISAYILLFGAAIMLFRSNALSYFISIVFVILGFSATIAFWCYLLWMSEKHMPESAPFLWNTGLPGTLNYIADRHFQMPSYNPTEIEALDHAIEQLLYLFMRDFVLYWHDNYFKDKKFPELILLNLQLIIDRLCHKIKAVKWTNLCAIKINAIFALHVKIFIKAIKILDERESIYDNHEKIINEFFNIEKMMPNILSHRAICTDRVKETEYLTFIIESFLYFLLPEVHFEDKVFRYFIRDVLVGSTILPFIDKICDPDYINQAIQHRKSSTNYTSESFISAIRITHSAIDLHELIEAIQLEITRLSGNDMNEKEFEDFTKKQISSLLFIKRLCMNQLEYSKQNRNLYTHRRSGSSTSSSLSLQSTTTNSTTQTQNSSKTPEIPFNELLENNLCLPYLVDYFQEIGDDHFLFLYFGIKDLMEKYEPFVTSLPFVNKSLSLSDERITNLRREILTLVNTYEKQFDLKNIQFIYKPMFENIVKEAYASIPIMDSLKSLRDSVLNYLKDPNYLTKFYSSSRYTKLCSDISAHRKPKAIISEADLAEPSAILESIFNKEFTIDLIISDALLCGQQGQQYISYVIHVMVIQNNVHYTWNVLRRFRHFVEFHVELINKFPIFSNLMFPDKKFMGNKLSENIEKRRSTLDAFLKTLISQELFRKNLQFFTLVSTFIDKRCRWNHSPRSPDANPTGPVSNSENPDLLDPFFKSDLEIALSKDFLRNLSSEDIETLSMSILVNLIEELFDLRSKTPLLTRLTRQVKSILKEWFIAAFGERVIRKIIDEVDYLFTPQRVTECLNKIRESFWPSNIWAPASPPRSENAKARARITSTAILIGMLPNELRRFLGDEVSVDGIYKLFNLLQIKQLNKRLFYTVCESVTEALFSDNSFPEIFKSMSDLYSKS